MATIHLLTGNKGKILAAQKVFSKYGIDIKPMKVDYPEIQADTSLEIACHTAIQAAKDLKAPVIREDHSFFINALGGIPGPYMAYFDINVPVENLIRMMRGMEDRSAFFELAAVYATPDGEIREYVHQVPIEIASEPRGDCSNWDKALKHPGSCNTFAETDEANNPDAWNKNFVAIAEDLIKDKEKD